MGAVQEFPTGATGLRRLRRLARDRGYRAETGTSVVEGPALVGEALDAGRDVRLVVVPASTVDDPAVADLLARALALGIEVGSVVDRAFAGLTSTRSPQPAIAEVADHDLDPAALVASARGAGASARFAQESFRVIVRLKTGAPDRESSVSTMK